MVRRLEPFLLLLVTVALATGCSTLPKRDVDFDSTKTSMTEVAVMPPSFQLQEVGAFSSTVLSDMNHDIEVELKSAAESVIQASEIDVAILDVDDAALEADPELRRSIFEQAAALSEVRNQLEKSGKTIDIGYQGDIDYFADMADCDYLVFIEGGGFFMTSGAEVKGAVIAGISAALFGPASSGPSTSTFLAAFIIDANRGKVLWYNEVEAQKNDPRKPSNLTKTAQLLFKPLLGRVRMDIDKSRDEVIIDKYKDKMKQIEAGERAAEEKDKE